MLARTFRRLWGPTVAKRFYPCRDGGFDPDGYGPDNEKEYRKTLRLYKSFCDSNNIKCKDLKVGNAELKICQMRSHMATVVFLKKNLSGIEEKEFIEELEKHREHRLEDLEDFQNRLKSKISEARHKMVLIENLKMSNRNPIKSMNEFMLRDFDINFWDRESFPFKEE